jgi:hypothetical protein
MSFETVACSLDGFFFADKPTNDVLLREKNIVPWLISRADKFKRIGWS